jgi:hypothetical protein
MGGNGRARDSLFIRHLPAPAIRADACQVRIISSPLARTDDFLPPLQLDHKTAATAATDRVSMPTAPKDRSLLSPPVMH